VRFSFFCSGWGAAMQGDTPKHNVFQMVLRTPALPKAIVAQTPGPRRELGRKPPAPVRQFWHKPPAPVGKSGANPPPPWIFPLQKTKTAVRISVRFAGLGGGRCHATDPLLAQAWPRANLPATLEICVPVAETAHLPGSCVRIWLGGPTWQWKSQ